jgi:hypothetical protein
MELVKEKEMVLQELINIMNEGLENDTKLTHDILVELRDKINNLIENDF